MGMKENDSTIEMKEEQSIVEQLTETKQQTTKRKRSTKTKTTVTVERDVNEDRVLKGAVSVTKIRPSRVYNSYIVN